jgi:hypothetical protein
MRIDVDLSPDSPEAKEARTIALRLFAARCAAGKLEAAAVYHAELKSALDEITTRGLPLDEVLSRVAHLLAASIEIGWALRVIMTLQDPEDYEHVRTADDSAVLALIEETLDELAGDK